MVKAVILWGPDTSPLIVPSSAGTNEGVGGGEEGRVSRCNCNTPWHCTKSFPFVIIIEGAHPPWRSPADSPLIHSSGFLLLFTCRCFLETEECILGKWSSKNNPRTRRHRNWWINNPASSPLRWKIPVYVLTIHQRIPSRTGPSSPTAVTHS